MHFNNVYLEITNVCNLHCSFCPSSALNSTEPRQFMEPALFKSTLHQIRDVAENVYFHVLGEPTLHPNFCEFLTELASAKLKLNLTTNGTTIEKSGIAILESLNVRQVNFSIHAYAELEHEQALKHLNNVFEFCKIAREKRPDMYINLRLWNVGDEKSKSWNNVVLNKITESFGTQINLDHFCSKHKSFNIVDRIYVHQDSRFEWPDTNGNIKPSPRGTCRALDTHIAILHDGRVVACCLDYSGQITLGNIKEQALVAITESPYAKNLKDGFANHELRDPFCQHCKFCKRFG